MTTQSSSAAIVLTFVVTAGVAYAQPVASTGIAADRLRPAIGPTTLAATEGADPTPPGKVSTMFALGYVRDPITLRAGGGSTGFAGRGGEAPLSDGSLVSRPVEAQLTGTFGFEVGLPRGFAIRASLPIAIVNDGDRLRGTGVGASGNDLGPTLQAAAGDLMFGVKVGIVGAPSLPGLHAALALDATVPLGGQAQFAATDGPTIAPRLMIDLRLPWITFALDAQARFMRQRTFFTATFGDEIILAGGAIARVVSFRTRWHLFAYVEGQGIIAGDAAARPGELRGALRIGRADGLGVDLGAGGGLVDAVGSPRYRLFAILRAPLF